MHRCVWPEAGVPPSNTDTNKYRETGTEKDRKKESKTKPGADSQGQLRDYDTYMYTETMKQCMIKNLLKRIRLISYKLTGLIFQTFGIFAI